MVADSEWQILPEMQRRVAGRSARVPSGMDRMSAYSGDRKRRLFVIRQQGDAPSRSWNTKEPGLSEGGHVLDQEPADDFFAACGSKSVPRLEVVGLNEDDVDQHVLERPFFLIGRSKQCDLRIPHSGVSHRHAYLQIVGGRLLCCDLASRNGTHWRGGARPFGWVDPGEEITIGPYRIRHVLDEFTRHSAIGGASGELSSLVRQINAEAALPDVRIEFLNSRKQPSARAGWQVRRNITLIGGSPLCKLRMQHESVSRMHSSLVLTAEGLWVVDLLGRGGTLVNDEPVQFRELCDGDRLQIGRFCMGIRYGTGRKSQVIIDSTIVPQNELVETSHESPDPTRHASAEHEETAAPHSSAVDERQLTVAAGEALPAAAPAAGAITGNGLSEQFVLGLFETFSAMQQQMFAQFQQQMMGMMQTFGSIHQSQQSLIRQELLRVHEISAELQQLQSEMLRYRARAEQATPEAASTLSESEGVPVPAPSALNIPVSGSNTMTPEDTPSNGVPIDAAAADSFATDFDPAVFNSLLSSIDITTTAVPNDRAETPRDATSADEPSAEIEQVDGSTATAAEAAVQDAAPESDEPSSDDEPAAAATETPATSNDAEPWRDENAVEMHAWLVQRMGALERERNGRWQKIMRALSGTGR